MNRIPFHLQLKICRVQYPLRPTIRPLLQKSNPNGHRLHLIHRWLLSDLRRSAAPIVGSTTCANVWTSADATMRYPRRVPPKEVGNTAKHSCSGVATVISFLGVAVLSRRYPPPLKPSHRASGTRNWTCHCSFGALQLVALPGYLRSADGYVGGQCSSSKRYSERCCCPVRRHCPLLVVVRQTILGVAAGAAGIVHSL